MAYKNIKLVYLNASFGKNVEFFSFNGAAHALQSHMTTRLKAKGFALLGTFTPGVTRRNNRMENYCRALMPGFNPKNGERYYLAVDEKFTSIYQRDPTILEEYGAHIIIGKVINLHFNRKRKPKSVE